MKKSRMLIYGVAIIAICSLLPSALADTLQLRDGRVVHGKYLRGTEATITFEADGRTEFYSVSNISALTFGEQGATPAFSNRQFGVAGSNSLPRTVTVPAGTRLQVRMIDGVDSDSSRPGDRFRASLSDDLIADGTIVAPRGTDVYGRLIEAKEAGHLSGRSELRLELTGITVNQQVQPIVTGEYQTTGKSRGANTAKKVGGGAGLGALIGAIAGGGKGAAIGAGVGAGAGTAIQVMTRGQQVRVPSETELEFTLQQPATFSVR